MNKVFLVGRLTRDPEIYESQSGVLVAKYNLAVNGRYNSSGEQEPAFPRCVAFGKSAEFAQAYLKKGTKIEVVGRLQSGSYRNVEGQLVHTTEVVVESQGFVESKKAVQQDSFVNGDGFITPPADDDEELPFN